MNEAPKQVSSRRLEKVPREARHRASLSPPLRKTDDPFYQKYPDYGV
jgi:hypothetical protein